MQRRVGGLAERARWTPALARFPKTAKTSSLLLICIILNIFSVDLSPAGVAAQDGVQVVKARTDQGFLTANDGGLSQGVPIRNLAPAPSAPLSLLNWICDPANDIMKDNMEFCISRLDAALFSEGWLKATIGNLFGASSVSSIPGPRNWGGANAAKLGTIFYNLRMTLAALVCNSLSQSERLDVDSLLSEVDDTTVENRFVSRIYKILSTSQESLDFQTLIADTTTKVKAAALVWQEKILRAAVFEPTDDPVQEFKNGTIIQVNGFVKSMIEMFLLKLNDFVNLYKVLHTPAKTKDDVTTAIEFLFTDMVPISASIGGVLENTIPKRLQVPASSVSRPDSAIFTIQWGRGASKNEFKNGGTCAAIQSLKGVPDVFMTTDKPPVATTVLYLPASVKQTVGDATDAIKTKFSKVSLQQTHWSSLNIPDLSKYLTGYDQTVIDKLIQIGHEGTLGAIHLKSPLSAASFLFSMAFLGLATYFTA